MANNTASDDLVLVFGMIYTLVRLALHSLLPPFSPFLFSFPSSVDPSVFFSNFQSILDDTQWANKTSCQLMKSLLLHATLRLTIIATAREVTKDMPISEVLSNSECLPLCHTIPLNPITISDVCDYLREGCGGNIDEALLSVKLPSVIHSVTAGHPFFVSEVVDTIVKSGVIYFCPDRGYWTGQMSKMASLPVAKELPTLLQSRILKLSPPLLALLKHLACVRAPFVLGRVDYLFSHTIPTSVSLSPSFSTGMVIWGNDEKRRGRDRPGPSASQTRSEQHSPVTPPISRDESNTTSASPSPNLHTFGSGAFSEDHDSESEMSHVNRESARYAIPRAIDALIAAGFLVKTRGRGMTDYSSQFRFSHDSVVQAVLLLLDPEEKKDIHLSVAEKLSHLLHTAVIPRALLQSEFLSLSHLTKNNGSSADSSDSALTANPALSPHHSQSSSVGTRTYNGVGLTGNTMPDALSAQSSLPSTYSASSFTTLVTVIREPPPLSSVKSKHADPVERTVITYGSQTGKKASKTSSAPLSYSSLHDNPTTSTTLPAMNTSDTAHCLPMSLSKAVGLDASSSKTVNAPQSLLTGPWAQMRLADGMLPSMRQNSNERLSSHSPSHQPLANRAEGSLVLLQDIARHYCQVVERIPHLPHAVSIVRLIADAGNIAISTGKIDDAYDIWTAVRSVLVGLYGREGKWKKAKSLVVECFTQLIDASWHTKRLDLALGTALELNNHRDILGERQIVGLQHRICQLYVLNGDLNSALNWAITAMQGMGVVLDPNVTMAQATKDLKSVLREVEKLGGPNALHDLDEMKGNWKVMSLHRILFDLLSCSKMLALDALYVSIGAELMHLTLQYGRCYASAPGVALFGVVLSTHTKYLRLGGQFCTAAEYMCRNYKKRKVELCRTLLHVGMGAHFHSASFRASAGYCLEAVHPGVDAGDEAHASLAALNYLYFFIQAGQPPVEVVKFIEKHESLLAMTAVTKHSSKAMLKFFKHMYSGKRGGALDLRDLEIDGSPISLATVHHFASLTLLFQLKLPYALQHAIAMTRLANQTKGLSFCNEHKFLSVIIFSLSLVYDISTRSAVQGSPFRVFANSSSPSPTATPERNTPSPAMSPRGAGPLDATGSVAPTDSNSPSSSVPLDPSAYTLSSVDTAAVLYSQSTKVKSTFISTTPAKKNAPSLSFSNHGTAAAAVEAADLSTPAPPPAVHDISTVSTPIPSAGDLATATPAQSQLSLPLNLQQTSEPLPSLKKVMSVPNQHEGGPSQLTSSARTTLTLGQLEDSGRRSPTQSFDVDAVVISYLKELKAMSVACPENYNHRYRVASLFWELVQMKRRPDKMQNRAFVVMKKLEVLSTEVGAVYQHYLGALTTLGLIALCNMLTLDVAADTYVNKYNDYLRKWGMGTSAHVSEGSTSNSSLTPDRFAVIKSSQLMTVMQTRETLLTEFFNIIFGATNATKIALLDVSDEVDLSSNLNSGSSSGHNTPSPASTPKEKRLKPSVMRLHRKESSLTVRLVATCDAGEPINVECRSITSNVPMTLVESALGLEKPICVGEAKTSHFKTDSYVKDYLPRSMMCFTVGRYTDRMRVVYLEQCNMPGAFGLSSLPVLQLVTSQMALVWDNLQAFDELRRKNLELRELDVLKDEFLACVSHELRTPLNGIMGIASQALTETRTPEELESDYSTIMQCSEQLLLLITDLLDFTKLRGGKLDLEAEPTEILDIINDTVNILRPIAREKNLRLRVRCGNVPLVMVDQRRIQQVLLNLIGNGLKFTEQGSVTVEVVQAGDMVHVSVKDTGIGIAKEDIPKVYEAFAQVSHSNKRVFEGTGLGVAISRQLVLLHGGDLFVDSQFGKGSTFTFTIPRAPPSAVKKPLSASHAEPMDVTKYVGSRMLTSNPASPITPITGENPHVGTVPVGNAAASAKVVRGNPGDPQSAEKRKKRKSESGKGKKVSKRSSRTSGQKTGGTVLCVDDNQLNLRILKGFLKKAVDKNGAPLEIMTTLSGSDAVELVKEKKVDVVLMDIMMPEMDGYETTRRIREKFPATKLPVIFVTAKSEEKAGYDAGGNGYIFKPVNRTELMSKVSHYLNRSPPPSTPCGEEDRSKPVSPVLRAVSASKVEMSSSRQLQEDTVVAEAAMMLSETPTKSEPSLRAMIGPTASAPVLRPGEDVEATRTASEGDGTAFPFPDKLVINSPTPFESPQYDPESPPIISP